MKITDITPSVLLYGSPGEIEAAFTETEHEKALHKELEEHWKAIADYKAGEVLCDNAMKH